MSFSSVVDAQSLWENPVKKTLREGRPVVGVTITVSSAEIAAQAASLGFDFLWIEMEHSPITLETLRNMVLATRGLKALPFVRVPVNELWMAKRVLDSGALGVIFPFTSTAQLARRAAAACRYPPHGRRGSGAGLATFRWSAAESYYDFADRNVMTIVNIEDVEAVENIEAIAATPGIDVLFIGTSDLAFSLGVRGDQEHGCVREAVDKIVGAARKNQKFLGRPATDADRLKKYVEQGFLFFQAKTDLGFMAAGSRPFLESLGKWGLEARQR